MNWPAVIAGVLVVLASGASGALVLLHRGKGLRSAEQKFGLHTPHLKRLAAVIGTVTGMGMGGIAVYFLALNSTANVIEWIGRSSYILVAGASKRAASCAILCEWADCCCFSSHSPRSNSRS